MNNQFFYSLTLVLVFGIFSLSSFTSSNSNEYCNNTFTKIDFAKTIQQDSTPHRSRSKETYRVNDGDQKIYLSIVDGEIKKLKINGKKIPRSEYAEYADLIEEVKDSNHTPTPPTPPSTSGMEEIEKAHEEIAKAHSQIEEAHRAIEKSHDNMSEIFTQTLIEDGLISDAGNYKIYLSKKKFKVDRKTQDKATHQKYLNLYETLRGSKMSKRSVYRISHNES